MRGLKGRELWAGLALGLLVVAALLLLQRGQPERGPQPRAAASHPPHAPLGTQPDGSFPAQPQAAAPGDERDAPPEPPPSAPPSPPQDLPGAAAAAPLPCGVIEGMVLEYGPPPPETGPPPRSSVISNCWPRADVVVEVEDLPDARVQTGADGGFTIEGVPWGRHVVVAREGERWASAVTDVGEGRAYVRLELHEGGGTTLEGRVLDGPAGAPGAEVMLFADGPDEAHRGLWAEAVSGEEGQFAFRDLPPGPYVLLARGGSGRRSALTAIAVSDPTPRTDLRLEEGARISGRVVDEAGRPLAGVELDARAYRPFEGAIGFEAVSGADGTFSFEGLGADYEYFIFVEGDDVHTGAFEQVIAPTEGYEIVLQSMGGVRVRVEDSDGAPVRDATVWLVQVREGTTLWGTRPAEPPGTFVVGGRDPGAYMVEVRAPGHANAEVGPLLVQAGTYVELTVTLAPGLTIQGRLLDPDGLPVGGSHVFVGGRGPFVIESASVSDMERYVDLWGGSSGATDPDGTFTLPCGASGTNCLAAIAEGYPPAVVEVDVPASGLAGVEIRFPRGGSVEGAVTNLAGAPLVGVMVLERDDPAWPVEARATVSPDGRFRADGLLPGAYRVGFWQAMEPLARRSVVVEAGRTTRLDIRVGEGLTVRGRVLRGEEPVAGAQILLLGQGDTPGSLAATSDSSGAFVIEAAAPGAYQGHVLLLDPAGQRASVRTDVLSLSESTGEILLRLPAGSLAGRVIDAQAGDPIGGARVIVQDSRHGWAGGWTAADGSFALGPIEPGPCRVNVQHEQYDRMEMEGAVAREGLRATDADAAVIRLQRGVPVAGVVLDAHGDPVVDAEVSFVAAGDTPRRPVYGEIRTDEDGRFSAFVVGGTYDVYVRAGGFGSARLPNRAIFSPAEISVVLGAAGALDIRVLGSDGAPVADVHVYVLYPDGAPANGGWPHGSSPQGRVLWNDLAPGAYRVRASRTWEGPYTEAAVEVRAGEITSVEIRLP